MVSRVRVIEIKLPVELAEELGLESVRELENHTRLLLAIDLYMSGKISLGRAAELAGLSYNEFWEALRERGLKIRVGPKSLEEARAGYETAKRFLR